MLLWILGLALVTLDIGLYSRYFSGANQTRGQETNLQDEFEAERQRVRELELELRGHDLRELNLRASFINEKIAERTFAWSRLFDRIAAALPDRVRLTSLSPKFEGRRGRRAGRGGALASGEVQLEIRGAGQTSGEVLSFVDQLFERPHFRAPDLTYEAIREGFVEFALSVIYWPESSAPDTVQPVTDEADEPSADESPSENEGQDGTEEAAS